MAEESYPVSRCIWVSNCLNQCNQTPRSSQGQRGIGKYSQTQTLKIKLGSGGALLSDGDADPKSYASNLYLCMSHQFKDYATIVLSIQESYRN